MRVEMTEVDPSKLGDRDYPEPGSYHFEILYVDEEDPKSSAMIVDCEVLAGTTPNQEGKTHREFFGLKATQMSRIVQFAVALGMITEEEVTRHKAAGTEPNLDFAGEAVGRQFCGKLVTEEYQGKTRNRLNFNLWALDSPKAKGIPLCTLRMRAPAAPPEAAAAATDDPFGGDDLF